MLKARRPGVVLVACGLLSAALASEARADLNLHSSVSVACVGSAYGFLNTCEALRFTLSIPDSQVPIDATSPAVPGQTYGSFSVTQFSLQTFAGAWAYQSLLNASPGNWTASFASNGTAQFYGSQANSTGTGGYPPPPIFFVVQMAGFEGGYTNLVMQYGANGYGVGPNALGSEAIHQWSAGGMVTPVPEPASMILLGSGLLGLAGAARRRRRSK